MKVVKQEHKLEPDDLSNLLLLELNEKCMNSRELHKFAREHVERGTCVAYYTEQQLVKSDSDPVIVGFEVLTNVLANEGAFESELISAIQTYDPLTEFVFFVLTMHPKNPNMVLHRHLIITEDAADMFPSMTEEMGSQVLSYHGLLKHIPHKLVEVCCSNKKCDLIAAKRCSVCKTVRYCSVKCQKQDWKKSQK